MAIYYPDGNGGRITFDGGASYELPTMSETLKGGAINDKALQLDASGYLQKDGSITLGGQNFTICGRTKLNVLVVQAWGGIFSCDGNKLRLIRYDTEAAALEIGIKTARLTARFMSDTTVIFLITATNIGAAQSTSAR